MKTVPTHPALAGVLLLSISLAACSGLATLPPSAPMAEAGTEVTPPTPDPLPALSWANRLQGISAPAGWSVTPCDNPALLCVRAGKDLVGTVELIRYPIAETSLALASTNPETTALKEWVAQHYETIKGDRMATDPNLLILAKPAEAAALGNLPGLRYHLTIRQDNDLLAERSLGYVATDGISLYVITTGVINDDPTSPFTSDAALREFEPHLAEIVANLKL